MTTLEDILQKYFNCKVPFRNDGSLTSTGETAMQKLDELISDLHAIDAIPSATDAHSVIWEIVDDRLEEPRIKPILRNILKEGKDIELKNPPILTTKNGETFRCLYVGKLEREYVGSTDLVCLDAKWPDDGDEDFEGSIWMVTDLTDNSITLLKQAYDETIQAR